jgi:N-acetylneuraminic acid mutarotase
LPTLRATPEPTPEPQRTHLPITTGAWQPFPSLLTARLDHTATTLADGRILVVGGEQRFEVGDEDVRAEALRSVELYLPAAGLWTQAAPLHQARAGHRALLLPDGTVLIFGGYVQGADRLIDVTTAERFDPTSGSWTELDGPDGSTIVDAPVVLRDGRVFTIGGFGTWPDGRMRPELFDPTTNTWSKGSRAPEIRVYPAVTQLPDSTVLVAGGALDIPDGPPGPTDDAWRYDPVADTWRRVASMAFEVFDGRAFSLPDGRVLVIDDSRAQVYDPVADRWTALAAGRGSRTNNNVTLLPDGRILLAGSSSCSEFSEVVEIYDAARDQWIDAGTIAIGSEAALVVLPDGRAVTIGGGWGCSGPEHPWDAFADASVLDPATIH